MGAITSSAASLTDNARNRTSGDDFATASITCVPLPSGRCTSSSTTSGEDVWTIHPKAGSDLHSSYVLTGGELDFNLQDLPPGARPAPIHATLGVGQIRVVTSPCV